MRGQAQGNFAMLLNHIVVLLRVILKIVQLVRLIARPQDEAPDLILDTTIVSQVVTGDRSVADSFYVDQSNSIDSALLSPRSGNTPNLVIEGTLGYQVPNFEHIELIAGGRILSFDEPQTLMLPRDKQGTEGWADAFVGARIKYDFSNGWYASLRADVGGLNARVDDRYSVAAFVGYRLNEITTLELGYRQTPTETREPIDSVPMQGVGLGLGIRF